MAGLQGECLRFHCVEKDFHFDHVHIDDIKSTISHFGDILETCSIAHAWQPVIEVMDSHPGHEANIMEVKFLNEVHKMAAGDVPKIEVKVERCDPPVGARVMRLQSHGEHRKAAYKVRFHPPRDVMYRTKLKIDHTKLTQDIFPFRCMDERGKC